MKRVPTCIQMERPLYFSSKGHNSMGGFDVFSVEMLEDDEDGRTTFGVKL